MSKNEATIETSQLLFVLSALAIVQSDLIISLLCSSTVIGWSVYHYPDKLVLLAAIF